VSSAGIRPNQPGPGTADGFGTDIADSILESLGAETSAETDPIFLPLGPVGTFGFEFQCDAYQDF
jgi:hypothetical protein